MPVFAYADAANLDHWDRTADQSHGDIPPPRLPSRSNLLEEELACCGAGMIFFSLSDAPVYNHA